MGSARSASEEGERTEKCNKVSRERKGTMHMCEIVVSKTKHSRLPPLSYNLRSMGPRQQGGPAHHRSKRIHRLEGRSLGNQWIIVHFAGNRHIRQSTKESMRWEAIMGRMFPAYACHARTMRQQGYFASRQIAHVERHNDDPHVLPC